MKFACLLLTWACLASAGFSAGLKWERTEVVRDARLGETPVSIDFAFVNDGPEPIRILEIEPECGCTTAALPKREYQPGEAGKLVARFIPGARRGTQEKKIFVTTDEGGRKRSVLTFKVKILEPVNFDPRPLIWEHSDELTPKKVRIRTEPGITLALKPMPDRQLKNVSSRLEAVPGSGYELTVTPPEKERPAGAVMFLLSGEKDGLTFPVEPLVVIFR